MSPRDGTPTATALPAPAAPAPGVDRPSACSELSHELGRQSRLLHLIKAQLAGQVPAGLDWAALTMLVSLLKHGPSRQGELADHSLLDPSTVSRHTAQLVRAGLVARRPDPEDGRAVQVFATEAGKTVGRALLAQRQQLLQGLLTDWPDEEVETLLQLTRRLNDGLERGVIDGLDPNRIDHRPGHVSVPGPLHDQHTQEN